MPSSGAGPGRGGGRPRNASKHPRAPLLVRASIPSSGAGPGGGEGHPRNASKHTRAPLRVLIPVPSARLSHTGPGPPLTHTKSRSPQLNLDNIGSCQAGGAIEWLPTLLDSSFCHDQPTTSPLSALREQLETAMGTSTIGQRFFPVERLPLIVRPDTVRMELHRRNRTIPSFLLDIYAEAVCKDARSDGLEASHGTTLRKVFAILTLMGVAERIVAFISGGTDDSILPLETMSDEDGGRITLRSSHSQSIDDCILGWESTDIIKFENSQWLFLPGPPATPTPDAIFQGLRERSFPFIPDTEHVASGGFGHVFRARIHPDYRKFLGFDYGPSHRFAVKRLDKARTSREDFNREREALIRLRTLSHPHLTTLLSTYQDESNYYILFPWADGDLRSFWEQNPKPRTDTFSSLWIMKQLIGLADGLSKIHNLASEVSRDAIKAVDELHQGHVGRHGDIKPENILWYKERDGAGVLKITDFGHSSFKHSSTELSRDRPKGATRAYMAPECDVSSEFSHSWDVWSLGCLFLEFVTWYLLGNPAVDLFAKLRDSVTHEGDLGKRDLTFFEIQQQEEGGKPTATLKSSVMQWITMLREVHGASPFTNELLNLIEMKMITVDPRERAPCSRVLENLTKMELRCTHEPDYVKSNLLRRKPPWTDPSPCLERINNTTNRADPAGKHFETSRQYPNTININLAHVPGHCQPDQVTASETAAPNLSISNMETSYATEPTYNRVNTHLQQRSNMLEQLPRGMLPSHQSGAARDLEPPNKRRRTPQMAVSEDGLSPPARKRIHRYPNLSPSQSTQNGAKSEAMGSALERSGSDNSEADDSEQKLACPFYRHHPTTFKPGSKEWKSCVGQGWTIPRLKEHIYRRHCASVYRCPRCFTSYNAEEDLNEHQRADVPCLKQLQMPEINGIEESQKAKIQKRIRGKSAADKWREIYKIIFPLDSSSDIPLPYWEETPLGAPVQSLADFKDWLNSRLDIDDSTGDGIRTCLSLIESFQRSRQSTSTSMHDLPPLTYDTSLPVGSTTEEIGERITAPLDDVEMSGIFSSREGGKLDDGFMMSDFELTGGFDDLFAGQGVGFESMSTDDPLWFEVGSN
ncbi:kinase-like protein [Thozetella sp. PMI_491]|nr:kinase-like protein [Thozetella sp. PMI_491]